MHYIEITVIDNDTRLPSRNALRWNEVYYGFLSLNSRIRLSTPDATLARLIRPTRSDFVGRISKAHPAFFSPRPFGRGPG